MFTALTLSMALGAPVPPPAAPVATGTAPRVMELKPNADGKIVVVIVRTEMQKVPVAVGGAINPNGAAPAVFERQVTQQMQVELGEVKDLAITTADGKKLDKEEAIKRLEKGAIVVISGDGNAVSPAFLKVFKDETLVLAAKELVTPQIGGGMVRPGVRPLPAIQPGGVQILPANPGGAVQIQIQGGGVIQVAPALPAVPVVPVPPKPEK